MAISDTIDGLKESISDAYEGLETRLGSRSRARAVVAAGLALVLGACAGVASCVPGQVDVDDVRQADSTIAMGDNIDGDTQQQKNTATETSVPQEAMTVRELSALALVEADVTGVVDEVTITVELPDGDECRVRLLDCEAGPTPLMSAEGGMPYYFAKEQHRHVWLERADADTDEDGTWARYVWISQPTGSSAAADCLNVIGCSSDNGWFTYKQEVGRYRAQIEAAAADAARAQTVADEADRAADALARRKAEQEAKEKAEQEAKEKAEQEAKEKAEQEAKEKAEQEAKEKATVDASKTGTSGQGADKTGTDAESVPETGD